MISESQIIQQIASGISASSKDVICGIGDDCAVIRKDSQNYWLLTTDALVEGVHFKRGDSARFLGQKSWSTNASDVAAMGGKPHYALMSLGLPDRISSQWIRNFYAGVKASSGKTGGTIIGGNVSRSSELWISLTMVGSVPKGNCKFRKGARVGDTVWVSGPLGVAAQNGFKKIPPNRLKEGMLLGSLPFVTAMMDISDGLMMDLGRMALASGVGATIYFDHVPHPGLKPSLVLTGGEDYELLFTVRAGKENFFQAHARRKGFKFFQIGVVKKRNKVEVVDRDGSIIKLKSMGYDHFLKG